MDIIEWSIHHIKQRDLVKNNLVSFKQEEDKILCEYKDSKATYFCREDLSLEDIKKTDDKEAATFVCRCNEHNFKTLYENWDLFKKKLNLSFIFVNASFTDKWMIKPSVHAKIADPATLKQGLRSMYDLCCGA